MPAAAMLWTFSFTCAIDQELSHSLRGNGKEVSSAFWFRKFLAYQLQIGFMDKDGRLQRVAAPLAPYESCRDFPQLVVDDGHKLIRSHVLTIGQCRQEFRNVFR